MNPLPLWIPLDVVRDLGWTLIHFLWLGALPAALLWAVQPICRSATTRHNLALGALVVMAIAPIATFLTLHRTGIPGTFVPDATDAVATGMSLAPDLHDAVTQSYFRIEWLVILWLSGVIALSLRMAGGWWLAQGLRDRETSPLPSDLLQRCNALRQRLALTKPVQFLQSHRTAVPMVIGWLRPVVLLPVSALTGIPPQQLDALILHELAHIRRLDAFTNVFMMIVETVLFYHPAVWWVSGRIRTERENCCDDLAVNACGDATTYVEALTSLEIHKAAHAHALAANGSKLKSRVARLLGYPVAPARVSLGAIASGMLMCFVLVGIAVAQTDSFILTVGSDGKVSWKGMPIATEQALDEIIKQEAAKKPQPELLIHGAGNTRYEFLGRILAMAARHGIQGVGFATTSSNGAELAARLEIPRPRDLTAAPPQVVPEVVDLELHVDGHVLWNGTKVMREQELVDRFRALVAQSAQAEVHVRPNPQVKHEYVVRAFAIAQRLGVQKIGFVGNDRYLRDQNSPPSAPVIPRKGGALEHQKVAPERIGKRTAAVVDKIVAAAPVVPATSQEPPIVLVIGADGAVFWDGAKLESGQALVSHVKLAAAQAPQRALRIQLAADARYQYIQQVIDLAQQYGIQRVQTLPSGRADKGAVLYDLPEIVGKTKSSPAQFKVALTLELDAGGDLTRIQESEAAIVGNLGDYLRQNPPMPNDYRNAGYASRMLHELRERANASSRSTAVKAVIIKTIAHGNGVRTPGPRRVN